MRGSDILSRAQSPAAPRASRPPRSPERFRLTGPTVDLDRRVNAVRRDVADVALAGRLFAPHYAAAHPVACLVPSVPMRAEPSGASSAVSELRLGDRFALLDRAGGWAWGYSMDDHYVGYVPADALGDDVPAPDHVVAVRGALLFAAPDIKAPVVATWPMGARFAGTMRGEFVAAEGGFLHRRHVRALDAPERDPATVAERLVGTAYRWGGRSGAGIDCSGLVQLALDLCGVAGPRDSDQQRAALGDALADGAPLRRGDLAFFPGHAGLMVDETRLIHANAFWMAVTIEPLADVIARLAVGDAATFRRLA